MTASKKSSSPYEARGAGPPAPRHSEIADHLAQKICRDLGILEAHDLKSLGFGSPEYVRLFAEAKKLAFEDRVRL